MFRHCRSVNPVSNPMFEMNSCTKNLLIQEIYVFINFREFQKMYFSQTLISANQTKTFIVRTLVLAN